MFVLWRNAPYPGKSVWNGIALVIALMCVLVSLAIAWRRRGQRLVTVLSLAVGVSLAFAALSFQASGLRTRNPQMISEEDLDAPFSVAEGMLISAAPSTILALRIGRMGVSSRKIWWSGFGGVWLPLLTSVGLVSVAKMEGTRLYWKPSLPIEFTYAFVWLLRMTDNLAVFLWPLSLTVVGPCLICAIWIRDLTGNWSWGWQKLLALTSLAAAAYVLTSPFLWALYYPYWLWSIVISSVLLAVARLLLWVRAILSP